MRDRLGYRKAAAQGYASAQFNLGHMYNKGQGVTQDYPMKQTYAVKKSACLSNGLRSDLQEAPIH